RLVVGAADRIAARPLPFILFTALSAALALAITLEHLRIDTSTTEMISPDVPFRRHQREFREAFPAFRDTVVAVIEGRSPERVEQAADALAEALRASEQFTAVDYPPGEPFFARHALLYLPVDELEALSDQLAEAQPLLAALAENPSLRGLADFLALALDHPAAGGAPSAQIDRLLDAMAGVIEAQLAGRFEVLSWRRALNGAADAAPAREIVVAEPRLDFASMAPAAAPIAALRTQAADLGITPDRGLSLNLTGAAVLDTEELASAGSGAALASVLATVAVAVLLVWGLRSVRLIVATLATLAIGLILTAGFATLSIGRLNLISVTFAV